ncbi:MAG: helix-turn-helix transcriptional regulator [Pseudohongiellaceae bacterium]
MGIIVRGRIVRKWSSLHNMNISVLEELGSRIRESRKALGWTQEELADNAGIDRSYIGGVERGERNLTFKVLCQICVALRCDVATLTKGIPELPQ